MIASEPTGRTEVEIEALPPEIVAVPRAVDPYIKVTDPVIGSTEDTFAVRVTFDPYDAGLGGRQRGRWMNLQGGEDHVVFRRPTDIGNREWMPVT